MKWEKEKLYLSLKDNNLYFSNPYNNEIYYLSRKKKEVLS
jgi:hypothetical protein